jgi:hypothetical protein
MRLNLAAYPQLNKMGFVERTQGNQTLIVDYGANSSGEFLVYTPSILTVLSGACEQFDDQVLRGVCLTGSGKQDGLERGSSRIKKLD